MSIGTIAKNIHTSNNDSLKGGSKSKSEKETFS